MISQHVALSPRDVAVSPISSTYYEYTVSIFKCQSFEQCNQIFPSIGELVCWCSSTKSISRVARIIFKHRVQRWYTVHQGMLFPGSCKCLAHVVHPILGNVVSWVQPSRRCQHRVWVVYPITRSVASRTSWMPGLGQKYRCTREVGSRRILACK